MSSSSTTIGPDTVVLDTLDEPVSATIKRDLVAIWNKVKVVLHPSSQEHVLRDWDLWGPLLLCLGLATILSFRADGQQASTVFTSIFVIIWCGSAVITLNSRLLGGRVSFFQSVCTLGYCVFPLVCSAVLTLFLDVLLIRLPAVLVAFAWSTKAAMSFLTDAQGLETRRVLALYPVILFYFVIAWMVLL
ncbi:MAG: Yip1 domain-containing protein [Piptocephalis tieghemiana]|nr:MAG: Yip1 domain-containing protein [Piptocephalis tieghemiana]